MKLRNAWRFVSRLASSLAVVDRPLPRPAGRVVLFSCYDVDRAMLEDDLHYSPLLEGIRDTVAELGYTCVNLSHPYSSIRSNSVKDGTITINYRAMALRPVVAALRLLGRAAAQARLDLETGLYARLLARLRPQAVFSIQPPISLCRAARRAGVRVIETMHGSNISRVDNVFNQHMARPDELLPQVILSFDDVSQDTLLALCAGRDIVPLRAFDPRLQHHRRRQAPRSAAVESHDKRVLVTLQWGYDGERDSLGGIIPNGIIHPALENAIAATAGHGITFWLRLHPIQMNAPGYRHHRRHVRTVARRWPHVEFERATASPLPLLLDEVSAHLTMSSSSVGEAAIAGVPSLMLCPTLQPGGANHGLFRELEAAGKVTFGRLDAPAIVAWLERCPPRPERARPAHDVERQQQVERHFYARLIEHVDPATAPLDRLDWCEDAR